MNASERRPGQLQTSSPRALAKACQIGHANSRVVLVLGCRSCAGGSARPATHGRANRGAGRAPDWKRHDTPDRRAEPSARYPALHGASAGIRVPVSIVIVISPVIVRVGEPVNMLITPVSVVPIGVVINDRPVLPVGIHPMHPPACAVVIAGDIGTFGSLGAGYRGRHQGCARNSENRTQSKCSVKPSHVSPFIVAGQSHPADAPSRFNAAKRGWFRPSICQQKSGDRRQC